MTSLTPYKDYDLLELIDGNYDVIKITGCVWEVLFTGNLIECKEYIDGRD